MPRVGPIDVPGPVTSIFDEDYVVPGGHGTLVVRWFATEEGTLSLMRNDVQEPLSDEIVLGRRAWMVEKRVTPGDRVNVRFSAIYGKILMCFVGSR